VPRGQVALHAYVYWQCQFHNNINAKGRRKERGRRGGIEDIKTD